MSLCCYCHVHLTNYHHFAIGSTTTLQLKYKAGSTVKLAPRGHVVMRRHLGYSTPDSAKKVLTAADFGVAESAPSTAATSTAAATAVGAGEAGASSAANPATADGGAVVAATASAGINLFADSFVPSFFRYDISYTDFCNALC